MPTECDSDHMPTIQKSDALLPQQFGWLLRTQVDGSQKLNGSTGSQYDTELKCIRKECNVTCHFQLRHPHCVFNN